MFIHIAVDVLSTCQNLKGSEFNVPVSETASLGTNLCPVFFKRELAPQKVMGLFVGVPLAGNNNETFLYIYRCILGPRVRLSLGSKGVD